MATSARHLDWEGTFREWSKPASDHEESKRQRAETLIREAIRESDALRGHELKVFTQGSYRNNTNVREDSDVDICVCCLDVLYSDYPSTGAVSDRETGLSPASYSYPEFKRDVGRALVAEFGPAAVTRGDKAFDVRESTARLEADVVPAFEHRRYTGRVLWNGRYEYLSGTEFRPDSGGRVINWPQQHYDNGCEKNRATGGRFKFMVRVIKRLRNEMAKAGIRSADPIPSYLVECLVWNVPNALFGHRLYRDDVRAILAHTFNETMTIEKCSEWGEVNELKYLFRSSQPWTRAEAHAFLSDAWDYVGFE